MRLDVDPSQQEGPPLLFLLLAEIEERVQIIKKIIGIRISIKLSIFQLLLLLTITSGVFVFFFRGLTYGFSHLCVSIDVFHFVVIHDAQLALSECFCHGQRHFCFGLNHFCPHLLNLCLHLLLCSNSHRPSFFSAFA